MVKEDTLVDSFVTVTKRIPLKARFLVAICMIVVLFELVSGVIELNSGSYETGNLIHKRTSHVSKSRERKEINPETMFDAMRDGRLHENDDDLGRRNVRLKLEQVKKKNTTVGPRVMMAE